MSWIAEYDTQGREFPSCVHVTKTTHTMTHGATYVPIEDSKAVRIENAKLRKLLRNMKECLEHCKPVCKHCKFQEFDCQWFKFDDSMHELGVDVE